MTEPASISRRLLGAKLIATSVACNAPVWLAFFALDEKGFMDGWPRWLIVIAFLPALIGGIAFLQVLVAGVHDLAFQNLRDGRLKTSLVGDDPANALHQKTIEEEGFGLAVAPLWILLGYAVVAVVAMLFIGGVALLANVASEVSKWPAWATVIAVLLVLNLARRRPGSGG